MKTGDTVKHNPTGETWVVAFSNEYELVPCGWPESYAKPEDCELIKKATYKERHNLLLDMAKLPIGDSRGRYARRKLGI